MIRQGFTTFKEGVFAVKQAVLANCGGEFWSQGEMVVSRWGDTVTLCGEAADLAELRAFVVCLGGAVEGDAPLMRRLFADARVLPVLSAPDAAPLCLPAGVRIKSPERLSTVYSLLCACDAAFTAAARYDAWLADFSHRCRHGSSRCYVLMVENSIVGTFSILFCAQGQALGGALAVLPQWRRRGFGSLLLSWAAADCAARGETLFLIAADGARASYYRRRGWRETAMAARKEFQEGL